MEILSMAEVTTKGELCPRCNLYQDCKLQCNDYDGTIRREADNADNTGTGIISGELEG